MERHTEKESLYQDLERKSISEVLTDINREDAKVATAVKQCIPSIENFIHACLAKMAQGGRLFYLGAGTSGRLGIVDASECPPTFGVSHDLVTAIMAGGDAAIRKAVEFAEDDALMGWQDLQLHTFGSLDTLVGIAASGTTPYVLGAVEAARKHGFLTAALTCNPGSPLGKKAEHAIEINVGPEYVTGSTRMKAGTAQKMVLNMISTSLMIKLGRVRGNRMVDMQLSNNKLVDRGTQMVMNALKIDYETANTLLLQHKTVRAAIENGL